MSEALLLVGHGSQFRDGADEMRALGHLVDGALPGVAVGTGFLEFADPPAGAVLDRLVDGGASRVVVQPLVLLGAGHAKSDVPAVVLEGRRRHPGVEMAFASPLGVSRQVVALLGEAVLDAGGGALPLLVIARGTSDPDANGDAVKAGRLLGEWTGAPFVHTAFTGVTRPAVPEALETFHRLGYRRIAAAFWFLCHGRLVARAREQVAEFVARTGAEVADAGYIGPDPRLVPVVVERYRQARGGSAPAVNCDLCAYRAPWPGIDGRVGEPAGVGRSHHAIAHRRRDHHLEH